METIEVVYCYQKLQKTIKVNENFVFPSYGDKVNEFNEFLRVIDVEPKDNKIFIKLEQL